MIDRWRRGTTIGGLLLLAASGCGRTTPAPMAPVAEVKPTQNVPDRQRPAIALEAVPEPPAAPVLAIEPTRATIGPDDPGVQFLAALEGADGVRSDRTASLAWSVEPEGVLDVEPGGYARGIGPGTATLTATSEDGASVSAVVEVEGSAERPWDFAGEIVPVFTAAGCNGGGCHGKAGGQNGFHLSLFGYDPEGDFEAITRGSGGRRISGFEPDSSLLLRKASGRMPHGGGRALLLDSDAYRLVADWIADGSPRRRGSSHGALAKVEVRPGDVRLVEPGMQQLRVVARYQDGHKRDVTRLARYSVNDDSAAEVDEHGHATLLRRAETDLIVRYRTSVVATRLATLINPGLDFDFGALPRSNLIDEELFRRLESLKVPPSPPSDDATFLRRVTLDLIGQQPRPDQIRDFLAIEDPEKRSKLVDRLMEHPLFDEFWHIKLGDLLQISQARFGNGVYRFDGWVKRSLAENMPWDELVRTLLTAVGDPNGRDGGPVNYALEGTDAREQAELTAQRFLGQRFRCAQCHDHPFDVWTQDDYYGLAAFFAKVRRPSANVGGMMYDQGVSIDPEGSIAHLRTGEPALPTIPGGIVVELEPDADPRRALADWMTEPGNPFFARSTANWVWAQFFGRGLAEPADDLSAANPPVHPELLGALADDFAAHEFDLRHLIRTVATSEAYGLSSSTVPGNERDTRLFSHQRPRPLTAHQIADALAQATDTELVFSLGRGGGAGGPLTTMKAVQVSDPSIPSVLLDTFGRCPRASGCAPVASPSLSLRQSLLLIGGDAIDSRIARFDGYLTGLLEFDPTPEEVVENLYLRTLCRKPSEQESSHWASEMSEAGSVREASEDLFWALLNSREFAFNH